MHRRYSEQRVRGTIVRSRDYWVDYVSEELKGSLYVLCDKQSARENRIIGWLSLRRRDDDGTTTKLQLQEFKLLFGSCSLAELRNWRFFRGSRNNTLVSASVAEIGI
jgi:hypothetical protein